LSRPDNTHIQLEGIPFPYGVRELGASVEVVKFEGPKDSEVQSWIQKNLFQNGEEKWGILVRSKSREETQCLTIGFKRTTRSRLQFHSGRLERTDEETTEPEVCEFHLKPKEAVLELYSYSAKQRSSLFTSIVEEFGKESLQELSLSKDAMKSLMTEAIEVSSVSLSGLGNPFFSDVTLTGTDPSNSKTYRELLPSGEIRSFRGKFQSRSEETRPSPLVLTISAKCKLRFFGGQSAVLQSDIEEFVEKIANIAQKRDEGASQDRKIPANL
jgi:hypothetical protein